MAFQKNICQKVLSVMAGLGRFCCSRTLIKAKLTILVFVLSFMNTHAVLAQNNGKSLPDGSYYTCTMDPKIHNDKPGTCPICGMTLVKVKGKKVKAKPKIEHEGHENMLMQKNTAKISDMAIKKQDDPSPKIDPLEEKRGYNAPMKLEEVAQA
jgi:hypothetical protein